MVGRMLEKMTFYFAPVSKALASAVWAEILRVLDV
jgi:hypothetical protein